MRVTVPEAAALLNATEVKVRAWIESGDLPVSLRIRWLIFRSLCPGRLGWGR